MKDKELFELCHDVHARFPSWQIEDSRFFANDFGEIKLMWGAEILPPCYFVAPLYTTDYLLEKLPIKIKTDVDRLHKEHGCMTCTCSKSYYAYLEVRPLDTKSMVAYVSTLNSRAIPFLERADTTTKALLKLVLALDDAGVKL